MVAYTRLPLDNDTPYSLFSRRRFISLATLGVGVSAALAKGILSSADDPPRPLRRCEVVVDVTDPLPRSAHALLAEDVSRISTSLAIGDQLAISTIVSEFPVPIIVSRDARAPAKPSGVIPPEAVQPLHRLFAGPRPQKDTETGRLFDNPKLRQHDFAAWQDGFNTAVRQIEAVSTGSRSSPILEALWILAADNEFSRAQVREVYLYSDLIQSSRTADFFNRKAKPSFDAVRTSAFLGGVDAFRGAKLTVCHLKGLNAKFQSPEVVAFWKQYASHVGFILGSDFLQVA